MMAKFNSEQGEENVINIVVIKEDPSNWQQTASNGIGRVKECGDHGWTDKDTGINDTHQYYNPLCKSQSFVIDVHPDANASAALKSRAHSLQDETDVASPLSFGASGVTNNDIIVQESISNEDRCKLVNYSCNSEGSRDHDKVLNYSTSNTPISSNFIDRHTYYHTPKITFDGYNSMNHPTESHSLSSVEKSYTEIFTPGTSPQLFTPSQYYSPALVSQNGSKIDPKTPKVVTTPDSGFCTPSQFELGSANVFFTSTPRCSKSTRPKTSTPRFTETPKRSVDALHHKFSEMYHSIDWDSLDDSCVSEDPKEQDTSGEVSPNSSLRSVQWLKGFSVGDNIMKPLISSPPTPGDSCNTRSRPDTTSHLQQGDDETVVVSAGQSSAEDVNKMTGQCTTTSDDSRISSVLTMASTRSIFSASTLKPLPVIMAPTIPTYPQTKPVVTTQQSLPHTSVTITEDSCIKDNDNGRRRKALEELKMNKAERNIGRSKYTGKIFSRPGYSYMDLIKMAMQSSKEGEMTLKEIVTWIEDHFPFFKHEAKESWKSSIRHNLSLHSDFMKADEKKHGCKWKLCKEAKVQHNLHVPTPQEISNLQSAYLKKAKNKAPQPILPKVNAYALVPLHNLATPLLENSQQQQSHTQQQIPPPPQPAPTLLKRPVPILPKQPGDLLQSLSQQQQQEEELQYYHDIHQSHLQLLPSSQHHQVLQQLLHGQPSQNDFGVGLFQEHISVSDLVTPNNNIGFYHSSDSNSSQSLAFTLSDNGSDQTVGQNIQRSISCPLGLIEADTQNQDSNGGLYITDNGNTHLISYSESDVSLAGPQSSSMAGLNADPNNFPLNSVVEIREEEGLNPGEKKIIFVLQDSENDGKARSQQRLPVTSGTTGSNINGRNSTRNQSTNYVSGKNSNQSKVSSAYGKKKSRDGGYRRRQSRGPVLNLQSVLEDKRASDTLDQFLQEDDRDRKRLDFDGGGDEVDGFTQIRQSTRPELKHLNVHMQKAFQEQMLNPSYLSEVKDKGVESNQENGFGVERVLNPKQVNSINELSSKTLPNFRKRTDSRERMTIIKSKYLPGDGCDPFSNKTTDLCHVSSNTTPSRSISCDGLVPVPSSQCTTPSASQLVFNRLSSGDHNALLSPISSHSSFTFNRQISSDMLKTRLEERNGDACRKVGNPAYKSKSRRKQIHTPLTTEISPLRKVLSVTEIPAMNVVDEGENNVDLIGDSFERIDIPSIKSPAIIQDPPAVSLLTDIQLPSLEVLQHKPLHHQFISMGENSVNNDNCSEDSSADVVHIFPKNFLMPSPVENDKDIEHIFCSGSPMKVSESDKNDICMETVTDNFCPPDFETPPKLHFLSTFSTKDAQLIPSYNKVSSSGNSKYQLNRDQDSGISDSSNHNIPHHQHNFSADNIFGMELDQVDFHTGTTAQKRVCRDGNRGYGFVDLSLPIVEDVNSNCGPFSPVNTFMSMDTPPCGTTLHPPIAPRPIATSVGVKDVNVNNCYILSDTILKKSVATPSHTIHQQHLLNHHQQDDQQQHHHQQQQQQLLHPPSSSSAESIVRCNTELSPLSFSIAPSSLPSGSVHFQAASTVPATVAADISASFITPPCGSTPLLMSSPNNSSMCSSLLLSSLSSYPLQDSLPFPEIHSGMLDPSVLENLDSYINSLPGLSGPHFEGVPPGSVFPSIQN